MKEFKAIDIAGILVGAAIIAYNLIHVLANAPEDIIFMLGFISLFLFMAIYFLSHDGVVKLGKLEILAATIFVYLTYIAGFIAFKIYIFSPLAWSLTASLGLWMMCFIIRSKYYVKLEISKKIVTIFLFFYFLIGVFWRAARSYENYLALISTLIFITFLAYLITINLKEGIK